MKAINFFLIQFFVLNFVACQTTDTSNVTQENLNQYVEYNKLTPEEQRVIDGKGTERPYTGTYTDNKTNGTYTCKKCNAQLYKSDDKFDSHCGWPSFDDEIPGSVKRTVDEDGRRTEITCNNCGGHLGHVFLGEGFTPKNTRHCVNSISLDFYTNEESIPKMITSSNIQTAIFASGCFWGTEYHLMKVDGILSTEVGYIGGTVPNPSYEAVCTGKTGHAEACKVVFDSTKVSYEELAKLFFETHDPSQVNRQGPDIGTQYRSEVFYTEDYQKEIIEKLIKELENSGLNVATKITAATTFYPAENYHQEYYENKGSTPYCHIYTKRFKD